MGSVSQWQDRVIEQDVAFRVSSGLSGLVTIVIGQEQEGKRSDVVTWNLNRNVAIKLFGELAKALGNGPHPEAKRLFDRAVEEDRGVSF